MSIFLVQLIPSGHPITGGPDEIHGSTFNMAGEQGYRAMKDVKSTWEWKLNSICIYQMDLVVLEKTLGVITKSIQQSLQLKRVSGLYGEYISLYL